MKMPLAGYAVDSGRNRLTSGQLCNCRPRGVARFCTVTLAWSGASA